MKLGFAIKVVSSGAGEPIAFNRGPWVKKVTDKREYVKLFTGLQGTSRQVSFLTFDDNGCFLTVMQSIPGRLGDFNSGWVYIPSSVLITGEELVKVHTFVSNVIKESNIAHIQPQIEQFFSTVYPDNDCAVQYTPSAGDKYGVRYYDSQSLPLLLGPQRYQAYYSQYETIFLIDSTAGLGFAPEYVSRCADITTMPLEQYAILKSPTAQHTSSLGRNVVVKLASGQPFTAPVRVRKGESVQLLVCKDGCEPVSCRTQPLVRDIEEFPVLEGISWRRKISLASFILRDAQDGQLITSAQIKVNGRVLLHEITVPENSSQPLTYEISAVGYDRERGTINLAYTTLPINVTLHKRTPVYGGMAGGTVGGGSGNSMRQRLIGVGITLLVLVACYGVYAFFSGSDEPAQMSSGSTATENTTRGGGSTDTGSDASTPQEDLITYLDGHDTWTRDELANHGAPSLLFDDLNEFKMKKFNEMKRFRADYTDLIAQSSKMKQIANAMDTYMGSQPVQGTTRYTEADDINVTRYIASLQPKAGASTPPASESTGSKPSGSLQQHAADAKNKGKTGKSQDKTTNPDPTKNNTQSKGPKTDKKQEKKQDVGSSARGGDIK